MAERFYSIVRVPSLTVLAYSIRIAMMMIFGMCCVPIVDWGKCFSAGYLTIVLINIYDAIIIIIVAPL